MSAPPPAEAGSTKSRELYGNRVAALGKGRPTAPGNFGLRVVTSPSSRASPDADENAAKSAAPSKPNSVSPSAPPSRRCSSVFADRPVGPLDVADASGKAPETSAQLPAEAQLESQPGSQEAKSSEPPNSATRSTVSTRRRPLSVSNSSSIGPAVTAVTPVSSTPLKATPSAEDAPAQSSLATPVTYEPSPTPAEFRAQERPPVVTLNLLCLLCRPIFRLRRFPSRKLLSMLICGGPGRIDPYRTVPAHHLSLRSLCRELLALRTSRKGVPLPIHQMHPSPIISNPI
ncbi:hypothetical protein BC826DRAFT_707451 [Russula brevipes]|nr:hypothetical protein BC826DRAFT_707451 [Russula brevipes]